MLLDIKAAMQMSLEQCSCGFNNKEAGLGERMEKRVCCWSLYADLRVSLSGSISDKACRISWKFTNILSTESQTVDAVLIWGFAFMHTSGRLKLNHVKQTQTDYDNKVLYFSEIKPGFFQLYFEHLNINAEDCWKHNKPGTQGQVLTP